MAAPSDRHGSAAICDVDVKISGLKRDSPFSDRKFSLRSAPRPTLPACDARCAQSVFCDVHAAAKNGLDLFRGLRAANSVRPFVLPEYLLRKNKIGDSILAKVMVF